MFLLFQDAVGRAASTDRKSWGELFAEILQNPSSYVIWLILSFVILFFLSRLNNYMEVKGVNRAIYITRGFVSSLMFFVIGPIAFFILLNIFALINGVETLDVSFLWSWLRLTITTYWWLLQSAFDSGRLEHTNQMYTVHSMIRLLWVTIPLIFVWFRVAPSKIGKLLFIPVVIFMFTVTQYKKAPTTFLTEGANLRFLQPYIPAFLREGGPSDLLTQNHIGPVAIGLVLLIIAGFTIGFYLKRYVLALLLVAIGIGGFSLLIPPNSEQGVVLKDKRSGETWTFSRLDSLVAQLDYTYNMYGDSVFLEDSIIDMHDLTLSIREGAEVLGNFPDSLCDNQNYRLYFYDFCQNRSPKE